MYDIIYITSKTGTVAGILNQLFPGTVIKTDRNWNESLQMLRERERALICLVGCLKILPKDLCDRHFVVNLHPANIVQYPELKGLNPVEKFFELFAGEEPQANVLHRAREDVDNADCVYSIEYFNASTVNESYLKSRKIAVAQWIYFLLDMEEGNIDDND